MVNSRAGSIPARGITPKRGDSLERNLFLAMVAYMFAMIAARNIVL